jgi:glutathione peroxidase
MSIYDFEVRTVEGNNISLGEFKGKVLLIVNSATQCGFTPQYDKLQDMYEKYAKDGFVILDFPCNQFGKQAPGSDEEIVSFCDARFGITFPQFSKIDVNGETAIPLYQYLVKEKAFQGFDPEEEMTSVLEEVLGKINPNYVNEPDIKWNFTKFLVDRDGNVVERFEPMKNMDVVEDKMKELL